MEIKKTHDPRFSQVDDKQKTYYTNVGATAYQQSRFTASSWSTGSWIFQTNPPNSRTVIDRNVMISVPFELTLTGSVLDGKRLLSDSNFALRAYPISSIINNVSCDINGALTLTQPLSDIIHPLSRYGDNAVSRTGLTSITPNALDSRQDYNLGSGSLSSPFGNYDNAVNGAYIPRGAFDLVISGNTVAVGTEVKTVTIKGTMWEMILASPWYGQARNAYGGISNCSTLSFTFTLIDIARSFCYRVVPGTLSGDVLTSYTVDYSQAPTMYLGMLTPPQSILRNMAMEINYSVNLFNRYITRGSNSVAAMNATTGIGGVETITSNVIQLSWVPEKLYIMCRRPRSSYVNDNTQIFTTPDVYLPITSLNINFNNHELLSNVTQQGLYMMSVRNGLNQSWTEFSGKTTKIQNADTSIFEGTCGGPVGLEFSKDIPLDEGLSIGMATVLNLQVTVTCENVHSAATEVELIIITVTDGILSMTHPSGSKVNYGIVTQEMFENAPMGHVDYETIQQLNGGSFGSNIRRFFSSPKTWETIGQIGKGVGQIVAPRTTNLIEGAVKTGREIAQAARQDAAQYGGIPAGSLYGGRMISANTLKTRAR